MVNKSFIFFIAFTIYGCFAYSQTSLSFPISVGSGTAKFYWPYGPAERNKKTALSYSTAFRVKTKITPWLYLGSETGLISTVSSADMNFIHTGSDNTIPYSAEIIEMDYRMVYGYLFVFPEFHPFKQKYFYIRSFPVIKTVISDDYVKNNLGGFSGIKVDEKYYAYNQYYTRRHHSLLFFLDIGMEHSFSDFPISVLVELRTVYIPKSTYFEQKLTSRELDFPDNSFLLEMLTIGVSYNL